MDGNLTQTGVGRGGGESLCASTGRFLPIFPLHDGGGGSLCVEAVIFPCFWIIVFGWRVGERVRCAQGGEWGLTVFRFLVPRRPVLSCRERVDPCENLESAPLAQDAVSLQLCVHAGVVKRMPTQHALKKQKGPFGLARHRRRQIILLCLRVTLC